MGATHQHPVLRIAANYEIVTSFLIRNNLWKQEAARVPGGDSVEVLRGVLVQRQKSRLTLSGNVCWLKMIALTAAPAHGNVPQCFLQVLIATCIPWEEDVGNFHTLQSCVYSILLLIGSTALCKGLIKSTFHCRKKETLFQDDSLQ